jgi:hypothetical protein
LEVLKLFAGSNTSKGWVFISINGLMSMWTHNEIYHLDVRSRSSDDNEEELFQDLSVILETLTTLVQAECKGNAAHL